MLTRYVTCLLLLSVACCLIACAEQKSPANEDDIKSINTAAFYAQSVDVQNLKKDIQWIADDARQGRKAGTAAEDQVGAWLVQRYKQLGLQPFTRIGLNDYYDAFEIKCKHTHANKLFGENIIGVLPGAEQDDEYVIVSAHYDHLGIIDDQIYNGADDNASGVAALLELARIISTAKIRPKRSIVFIAFSGEEQNLQGARHFCSHVTEKKLAKKMLALNFEMFGAIKGQGKYLNIWNTAQSSAIVEAVFQASQKIKFPLLITHAQGFEADAHALQACGVAATTIDVGGGAHFRDNHPHYHSAGDDPEHIDEQGLRAATQLALIAVWQLANK
jgi:hypothetical protein